MHGTHACFNSIPRSREGKIVRTELRDKMIQETNELVQNPGRKVVFFRENSLPRNNDTVLEEKPEHVTRSESYVTS